jgi:glycogen operon protein
VVVIAHRSVAPTRVVLPEPRDGLAWELLADSAADGREGELEQAFVEVGPRSLVVLAETRVSAGRRPHAASDEALRRLARGAGIASDWRDLDGRLHAVSPQTQAALLAAMGWPAQSSEQARTALAALAELRDRRALPHAIVRRAGQPIAAPLRFDPGFPAPDTWLVVEPERGAPLRLRASLHAGAAVATRGADGRPGGELLVNLPPLAVGRYRLSREDRPDVGCRLTVAPTSAFLPGPLRDSRRFGVSAQLYSVRRAGDQGIGDFTSLGDLAAAITRDGAATLAINPLHALFPGQRERASPYFPSDRRLLDPIYLDLDRVLGAPVDPERRDALARLSSIDYPSVWALKAGALEAAFAAAPNPPGLDRFVAAGGRALADFSAFQAVAETRPQTPWQDWPADLRDAGGRGVQAFAAAHGNRVRFHQYLQWLCEAQLATAAERALGLHAGLCRDLAIGAAPDGAEAWARSDLMVRKVSIGAPPDQFSAEGQVWGLPPFDPFRLEIDGYAHFADVLARNMRHAGALRIDHVMGLARLFWIPEGAGAADGAYVSYPLGDLLGQVALESHASGCAVIGEDLGTAPEGLRESLQQESILRYCVLPFETDAGRFRPPEAYPQLALTCASTHDLPPLAGWWEGLDIAEREDLSLITPTAAALERARREDDKTSLVKALTAAGLLEKGADALRAQFEDVLVAMHAYVARSPSVLALAQLDDLAASRDAVNLPGTDRERPNWRRRLTATTGEILASPIARAIIAAIRETRPPGPGE